MYSIGIKILEWLSELFKDTSANKVSHVRVMSTITICVPTITWAIYVLTKGWVEPGESLSLLVGLGLGGKVAQRFTENRKENNSKENNSKDT